MESYTLALLVTGLIFLYLLPAIIAYYRKHHNMPMITVLTILFGWSGILWVVLVFYAALTSNTKDPTDDGFR